MYLLFYDVIDMPRIAQAPCPRKSTPVICSFN